MVSKEILGAVMMMKILFQWMRASRIAIAPAAVEHRGHGL
jgi:hypothetical protein